MIETLKYATETKARKEHICNFCGEKIREKEIYLLSTHIGDGDLYSWKTHKYCAELATKLRMYDDCDEGVTQDDFIESISEAYFDIMVGKFTLEDRKKYSEVIQQLRYVRFRTKLMYMIIHLKNT